MSGKLFLDFGLQIQSELRSCMRIFAARRSCTWRTWTKASRRALSSTFFFSVASILACLSRSLCSCSAFSFAFKRSSSAAFAFSSRSVSSRATRSFSSFFRCFCAFLCCSRAAFFWFKTFEVVFRALFPRWSRWIWVAALFRTSCSCFCTSDIILRHRRPLCKACTFLAESCLIFSCRSMCLAFAMRISFALCRPWWPR